MHQLKREFPKLTIAINGGIKDEAIIEEQLRHVDGVMVGRHAYHEPWALAGWDTRFFGDLPQALTREAVEEAWMDYLERLHAQANAQSKAPGQGWALAMRHALGLWNGTPGARRWRQVWSDHRLKALPPRAVQAQATVARLDGARQAA